MKKTLTYIFILLLFLTSCERTKREIRNDIKKDFPNLILFEGYDDGLGFLLKENIITSDEYDAIAPPLLLSTFEDRTVVGFNPNNTEVLTLFIGESEFFIVPLKRLDTLDDKVLKIKNSFGSEKNSILFYQRYNDVYAVDSEDSYYYLYKFDLNNCNDLDNEIRTFGRVLK